MTEKLAFQIQGNCPDDFFETRSFGKMHIVKDILGQDMSFSLSRPLSSSEKIDSSCVCQINVQFCSKKT